MRQLLVLILALTAGCTTSTASPDSGLISQIDSGPSDGGPADAGQTDAGPQPDAGPPIDDVLIYAHSDGVLYTFSAYTNTVEEIGPFQAAGGGTVPDMVDLAVDADGVVFTSSQGRNDQPAALWLVDPETAEVTKVGDIDLDRESFYALSFLAADQSPDGTQTLIGATNEGAYYEVDRDNADITFLGMYPDGWVSSGDIVSVDGLGTFATLKRDDYPVDVLARITFAADGSSLVDEIGDGICPPSDSAFCPDDASDFRQIFGLGYWGENLYGFSNSGQLIRIDRETGRGEIVSTATGADSFWGAGVTVDVPFIF